MNFEELPLQGSFVVTPDYHCDDRGKLGRLLCKSEFNQMSLETNYVQINHSVTKSIGTIRGLHYQKLPKCEAKIVKCIKGRIYDVIIDLRSNSPSFLNWYGIEISAENSKTLYIPKGFAHGFQTLEPDTELLYMHSEYYSPDFEAGLNWQDPTLNIQWPLTISQISEKDQNYSFINGNFKGLEI